jgi:hypothetical protein
VLGRLYPKLIHHGLTTFLSPDVMRFLGRKPPSIGTLPPRLTAALMAARNANAEQLARLAA